MLSAGSFDKDIMELCFGSKDNTGYAYNAGILTGKLNFLERGWFKKVKQTGKLYFTDSYVDAITGKLVVSAAVPVYDGNNAFLGVICEDISLAVLHEQAKGLSYHGEGKSCIIQADGKVLATSDNSMKPLSNFRDDKVLGKYFDEMSKNGAGYINVSDNGADTVFAYSTIPHTKWIIGISVPNKVVFGALDNMRIVYLILTILGIALSVGTCIYAAAQITGPIISLKERAVSMAEGNLGGEDLPVMANDEIGELTESFNNMSSNLKKLIRGVSDSSQQLAASSEELTANTHQAAEAAMKVAETIADVANGMESQMEGIDVAKQNVDIVSKDISDMSEKTKTVTNTTKNTAEAAKNGSELMRQAVERMNVLESSVMQSAEVVRKLGENSQQIGQIIEAISAIADQTNLLALNAAIEAARAGEHGRGFAVVAEEVRKLAEQSRDSAEQIKERIDSIQADTSEAVQAMEAGTDEVKSGTQAIREVGVKFREILEMVDGIQAQMAEIDETVGIVCNGATKIVGAVDTINEVSRKTLVSTQEISSVTESQSASNQEIAAAANALATMATEMQGDIDEFRI